MCMCVCVYVCVCMCVYMLLGATVPDKTSQSPGSLGWGGLGWEHTRARPCQSGKTEAQECQGRVGADNAIKPTLENRLGVYV